jgi:hypothetical protein
MPSDPFPLQLACAAGFLLLHGDYEYLSEGYYAAVEAELQGLKALPFSADALDAYHVPIALERVRQAGLPVPEWRLTNDAILPPAVIYGVHPFARTFRVVYTDEEARIAAHQLSRQGKYLLCYQRLPAQARLVEVELILDRTPQVRYALWAERIYMLFHLPLAKLRLIETPDGQAVFSALERLPHKRLSAAACKLLQERLQALCTYRG